MDTAEGGVEAKRSARQDRPGGCCHWAAALEPMTTGKGDEHVLALDTPILGECPFQPTAQCPGGDGAAARGRDEPIAASSGSVLARINDRRLSGKRRRP
jgi:hypothetical protein